MIATNLKHTIILVLATILYSCGKDDSSSGEPSKEGTSVATEKKGEIYEGVFMGPYFKAVKLDGQMVQYNFHQTEVDKTQCESSEDRFELDVEYKCPYYVNRYLSYDHYKTYWKKIDEGAEFDHATETYYVTCKVNALVTKKSANNYDVKFEKADGYTSNQSCLDLVTGEFTVSLEYKDQNDFETAPVIKRVEPSKE